MRTKYCPHCGSDKIHRVEEVPIFHDWAMYTGVQVKEMLNREREHYHECEDCDETWEHYDTNSRV